MVMKMKIKTPTEFKTFKHGEVKVYDVKNNKMEPAPAFSCRFEDRTVTLRRYYAARGESMVLDRVIQIPRIDTAHAGQNAVIGGERYKIETVQKLRETNPPVDVLSLRKIGVISDG